MTSQPGFVERVEARKSALYKTGVYTLSDAWRVALTEVLADSGHIAEVISNDQWHPTCVWIGLKPAIGTKLFTHPAPSELAEAQGRIARAPAELLWLNSHCRAIGMVKKSDSGKIEENIALFTIDLQEERNQLRTQLATTQSALRDCVAALGGILSDNVPDSAREALPTPTLKEPS